MLPRGLPSVRAEEDSYSLVAEPGEVSLVGGAYSKRTLAVIRQNIVFSLGVKAVFFALTFAGLASLWGAIAADVGASLLVVINALRLLRSYQA